MDDEPLKFLAIKNWSKFQPKLKNGKDRRDWIRLDTNRVDDPDFLVLGNFARGVLTGIMELRGRTGKNPPNDVTYLARAMHTIPTDRPHLRHTIDTLMSHGFLTLCNQRTELESATQDKTGQDKTLKPIVKLPENRQPDESGLFELKPPANGNGHFPNQVIQAWDAYIRVMGRDRERLIFTPARKRMGELRFKDCLAKTGRDSGKALGLMLACINQMALSKWHMGENPNGVRYNEWEHLFGTTKKLEMWIARDLNADAGYPTLGAKR